MLVTPCLMLGCLVSAEETEVWPTGDTENVEQPDRPLFEKMPFDRLTLTSKYNRATYDVLPIKFEGGMRPNPLPRVDALVVRMVNMPLKELRIFWVDVERLDLFCELVEQEFVQRLETLSRDMEEMKPDDDGWGDLSARFELMFDYLRYLDVHREELPGYENSYRKFLFAEGVFRMRSKDYHGGSARFERLYGKDGKFKDYPGLEKSWADALGTLMEEESLSGHEARSRRFLERFRQFYPANPIVEAWEKRLRTATLQRCNLSRKAFEEKEFLVAHRYYEEAADITAGLPELIRWRGELFSKAPRVDIAVVNPLHRDFQTDAADLPELGLRRGRRILSRALCDFRNGSLEGGVYASRLGTMERADKNRTLRWVFPDEKRNTFRFSVYDAADSILRFASGRNHLIESVEVTGPDRLEVRFYRSVLIPESFFVFPIVASNRFAVPDRSTEGRSENRDDGGLFTRIFHDDRMSGFELSPGIDSAGANVPPKVVFEHTVFRGEEAAELLLSGRIDMLERVPPWELEKFAGNREFVTGKYALPAVHFLVPNMRNPLVAGRTFRRALLYGLNRTGMLEKLLEKGGEGEVLSVPFIKGKSLGDPLGYGYDNSIRPRPYEPKLAIALSLLAFDQVRNSEPDWSEIAEMPTLVLARPKHEMAEYVALMVRRQWEAIGVPVRVVEYRDDERIGVDEGVDFWLVERIVPEPLVDAERLFGAAGLLRHPSPYMELALEKLRAAEDWPTAGKCLQNIHRLCFEETTVLPLWQLTDHYVHRVGIDGVRGETDILDLYQNILHWTVLPR